MSENYFICTVLIQHSPADVSWAPFGSPDPRLETIALGVRPSLVSSWQCHIHKMCVKWFSQFWCRNTWLTQDPRSQPYLTPFGSAGTVIETISSNINADLTYYGNKSRFYSKILGWYYNLYSINIQVFNKHIYVKCLGVHILLTM